MKQFITTLTTAAVLAATTVQAQMPYKLTVQNQAYTPLTGATVINTTAWTDSTSYVVPLGFNFKMGTKTINKLNLMEMSGVATDTTGTVAAFNIIGTAIVDRGIVGGTSKSPIRYTVSGNAGSRIFKLELLNAGFSDELDAHSTLNDSVNMQVWLYEGTDVVEMRYGSSKISYLSEYFGLGGPLVGYTNNLKVEDQSFDKIYLLKGSPAAPTLDSATLSSGSFPSLTGFPVSGTVYRFSLKSTGIAAFAEAENIKVFPTVCTDKVNVTNKGTKEMAYQLLSISGSVLAKGTIQNGTNTIDVSMAPAGMYVLTLIDGDAAASYKLIKQ